jgi:hypothetical protein
MFRKETLLVWSILHSFFQSHNKILASAILLLVLSINPIGSTKPWLSEGGSATPPSSVAATTITIHRSGQARAGQTAVIRVERNFFRNGGWGFRWRHPNPYGDQYNYGDVELRFPLREVIPSGSTLISAVLNYNFSNLFATTSSTRPEPICGLSGCFATTELGGNHAKVPKNHGSTSNCGSSCSPAAIKHWEPEKAFWASRVELEDSNIYWFPGSPRAPSGFLDLLSIYPVSALAGHTLTFVGTTQYSVGRPFFATEGRNADTEFDVFGHGQVDVTASLTLTFIPPEPTPTPTPTPSQIPPRNNSILPQSGDSPAGSVYTIRTVYTDPNGIEDIANVVLRAGESNSGALYAQYSAVSGKFYLLNDAGTTYQGGYAPGSTNVINNSRGALDCSLSKVETVGNQLVVTWAFVPSAAFVGTHSLYQLALDRSAAKTDLERMGSWTVMTRPSINLAPANVSMMPANNSTQAGAAQLVKTTYSDPNGIEDIANVVLRVGDSNSNALYVQYSAVSRKFYLLNDAGTAYQGGFAPGSPNIITNSRGALDCSLSKLETIGSQLVVTWALVPADSFAGTHNLFQLVRDRSGAQTDLERMDSWTIVR